MTVAGHDTHRRPMCVRERLGLVLTDEPSAVLAAHGPGEPRVLRRDAAACTRPPPKPGGRAARAGRPRRPGQARVRLLVGDARRGCRSRGRSSPTRPCCCSTSRPARSIPSPPTMSPDSSPQAADDGAAILFCSHRLDEVQEVCDRVAVLRDGRDPLRRHRGRARRSDQFAAAIRDAARRRRTQVEDDVSVAAQLARVAAITRRDWLQRAHVPASVRDAGWSSWPARPRSSTTSASS